MPLSRDGRSRIFLPDIPAAIISIPAIKSAIPIKSPTKASPARGAAIMIIEMMIIRTPIPRDDHLDHPLLSLSPIPWTNLDIPYINSATPRRYIRNTLVDNGNAITISDNMITRIPKPTLAMRDLLLTKRPVITFSIPTINNTTAARYTPATAPRAG